MQGAAWMDVNQMQIVCTISQVVARPVWERHANDMGHDVVIDKVGSHVSWSRFLPSRLVVFILFYFFNF